jgi:hypothetical protein
MNIESAGTFDAAEREYNEAWSAPSSTRFELQGGRCVSSGRSWQSIAGAPSVARQIRNR